MTKSKRARRTTLADLSEEQQEVVRSWGQGMAVMAGAGSGKTTTLVIKCEELLIRNPEARFAAVSFTEKSASDLRAKLSERLPPRQGEPDGTSPLSRHRVTTIHGLCASVLREFPLESGYNGDEIMLSAPESYALWLNALDSVLAEDLPVEIQGSAELLLEREGRNGLFSILSRLRDLEGFGALDRFPEDPPSRALTQLGGHVLERYDRLKRRRGSIDFQDLERAADRALEAPRVCEYYRKKFELVLVDEFQDTNPLQARIIERFCRPGLSNLCVVGDPKQSVYRFRDADVTVFDEFCSRLPVRLALTANFRSRPGIIEFVNRACETAFEASELQYQGLVARRESENVHPEVERLPLSSPHDLARWIQQQVAEGVPLGDMALLLRKIRGENEKWLKALTAANIPIALGSGGLFWQDPRVREMTALLKWWNLPAHSFSGAVFLRAPWMGIPDRELDAWVKEDPTWVKPFFRSNHPVAEALRPLRERPNRPGEILLALLANDDIEAELGAPLLGLWHRAEDLSARGQDFAEVVNELARAAQEERRERDIPPPRNLGQLTVLTIHGSKGLEFPHVIVVDLGKPPRASNAPLLYWDRHDGARLTQRDAEGERDRKDPIEATWLARERSKELAESKRLFYVALTRARERLVLGFPALAEKDEARLAAIAPEDRLARDDWRAWAEQACVSVPEAVVHPVRLLPTSEVKVEVSSEVESVQARHSVTGLMRSRHSVTEWTLLSRCPRAYEWSFIRPRRLAEGLPSMGLFTGKKLDSPAETEISQRELGTQVHACLESGNYDALRELEREVGSNRLQSEAIASWAMSAPEMAPAQEGRREIWTELEFEVPLRLDQARTEVVVGSIDRVVREEREEGASFSVIDFKVTSRVKSADSLLEAYGAQLALYAWALRSLEPETPVTRALLVNIAPEGIQTVEAPANLLKPDFLEERARELGARASEIVAGQEGRPRPGPLCEFCAFLPGCKEGQGR